MRAPASGPDGNPGPGKSLASGPDGNPGPGRSLASGPDGNPGPGALPNPGESPEDGGPRPEAPLGDRGEALGFEADSEADPYRAPGTRGGVAASGETLVSPPTFRGSLFFWSLATVSNAAVGALFGTMLYEEARSRAAIALGLLVVWLGVVAAERFLCRKGRWPLARSIRYGAVFTSFTQAFPVLEICVAMGMSFVFGRAGLLDNSGRESVVEPLVLTLAVASAKMGVAVVLGALFALLRRPRESA